MNAIFPKNLQNYLDQVADTPNPLQQKLLDETQALPRAVMLTPHDQTVFLSNLTASMNARKIIEVGVFTGYSTLAMAVSMPEDGRIIACDISTEWTDTAKRYWTEAGVADKIELRIAPATDTLNALIKNGQGGTFDFIYIDADKKGYEDYYEASISLLRRNGIVALDNMLWKGEAIDENTEDELAITVRNLTEKISNDKRVSVNLIPIGDGLLLARKK